MLKMIVAIGCAYSLVIKKLERRSNTLGEEEHRGEAFSTGDGIQIISYMNTTMCTCLSKYLKSPLHQFPIEPCCRSMGRMWQGGLCCF